MKSKLNIDVSSRDSIVRPEKLRIKALTFDLWETLLFETDGADSRRRFSRCENLAKTMKEFGVDASPEQVDLALKELISSLLSVWDVNKDVSHEDQLQLILKSVSKGSFATRDELIAELSSAYVSPVFEVPPYLNPDAAKVLKWLRKRKKHVGIICNTGLTPGFALRELLGKGGVAKYFDVMMFSDELGIRKPDPKIFEATAERLNAKPCEIIHVGDNLKSDMWGAKNAGFKAIHFASHAGRDKLAEFDPTSLATLSRDLGRLEKAQVAADWTIASLNSITKIVERFEA